jgi:hypothetical protein
VAESRSVMLERRWSSLAVEGEHPAGRSPAAGAVRGERCLPNAASRWGTPDLPTPVRAVAKSGVDAGTVEGDSLERRRSSLLSWSSRGRDGTEREAHRLTQSHSPQRGGFHQVAT